MLTHHYSWRSGECLSYYWLTDGHSEREAASPNRDSFWVFRSLPSNIPMVRSAGGPKSWANLEGVGWGALHLGWGLMAHSPPQLLCFHLPRTAWPHTDLDSLHFLHHTHQSAFSNSSVYCCCSHIVDGYQISTLQTLKGGYSTSIAGCQAQGLASTGHNRS